MGAAEKGLRTLVNPRSNEQYEITAETPLVRPGLKIKVIGCSKRYAADAASDLLEVVRMINDREKEAEKK